MPEAAVIECLDSRAEEVASTLHRPAFGGLLAWKSKRASPSSKGERAAVTFVVSSDDGIARKRVARHRAVGRFALPAPVHQPESADMLFTCVAATLCEGQPDVLVCLDFGDVADTLETPGRLLIEWSFEPNIKAANTVLRRLRARLDGGLAAGVLFLLSGGPYVRFKEIRAVFRACRALVVDDGPVFGGDALAPFAGKPGCCVIAIQQCRG